MTNIDKVNKVILNCNNIYDDIIVTDLGSLASDLSKIKVGVKTLLKVTGEDVIFDFLIHIKDSDKLLCLGSGAYNSTILNDKTIPHQMLVDYVSVPRFDRHTWGFKYSAIWYNDSTRYLMKDDVISAGWNIGTDKDWHLNTIGRIVKMIYTHFGYDNEDVLYYGSSLGGFMSIILAAMNRGRFIADCPQLDLETWVYIPKHLQTFERLFSGQKMEDVFKIYPHRFKVLEYLKKCKYIPDGIINITLSSADVDTQYVPFLKSLNELIGIFKNEDTNFIKVNILLSLNHTFLREDDIMKMIDDVFNNTLPRKYRNVY